MAENTEVFKVPHVRLNFPALAEPMVNDNGSEKYGGAFIIEKGSDADKIMTEKVEAAAKGWFKNVKPIVCLRDGAEKGDLDGYGEDVKFFSAAKFKKRPQIFDASKQAVTDPAELRKLFYSGCYVNVGISLWKQENSYGRRVNASLELIQFIEHGEEIGGKVLDVDSFLEDASKDIDEEDLAGVI